MSSPYFQKQDAVANTKKRKNTGEGDHPPKRQNVGNKVSKDQRCGIASPFFQKQDTVAKMTKRKKTGEGYSPPKKQNVEKELPKNQRCGKCLKTRSRCFGTPPFTVKCPACKKRGAICLPQGVKKKHVPKGLPKDQRCGRCFKRPYRCFGTPPFTVKCPGCEKRGTVCLPQGEKKQKVYAGLPKEQRCQACSRHGRSCFGTPPFNTSCRSCIERGIPCKPRVTEMNCEGQLTENRDKCNRCASNNARCDGGIPCSICIKHGYSCSHEKTKCSLPKDQCCNRCNSKKPRLKRRCDGERPCSRCRRTNTECRWTKGKETWIYRPDPSKWPKPTRIDYCAQCRKYAPEYFGGPPMQCNGEFPCNCCLQQAFGLARYACTYHIGNGISKRYSLDNRAAVELRKYTQDRYFEKRKRLARTRETERSTDKETINDDIIDFQNDRKANSNNDESMEQEGTDEETLDNNFKPHLPEDTKQTRETDQDWSLERGADDTDHEGFSHDSDQFSMEIDRDDAASQIGQRHVRGIPEAANDVNGSLDQVGRRRELKPVPTDHKSSAKGIVLDRSRPTTLHKKNRNIRRQNANARAQHTSLALTRRTLTRQHPSRPQSMLGRRVTRSQTKYKKASSAKSGRH